MTVVALNASVNKNVKSTSYRNRVIGVASLKKHAAVLASRASTSLGRPSQSISMVQRRSLSMLSKQSRTMCASNTQNAQIAILFDCDGVIVETEELHRLAYNSSFAESQLQIGGVQVEWAVSYYDVLQNTVGGGKPKMKWHFNQNSWPTFVREGARHPAPATAAEQDALVDHLQDRKTYFYKKIVEEAANARPGVLELMDEGLNNPYIAMGICSAATRAGFEKVVNSIVGPERLAKFDVIIAGDDVDKKKPDPMIYNVAQQRLGMPGNKCVVIEDSLVGLRAAVSAGCHCIITYTDSTATADFEGEGAKVALPNLEGQTVNSVACMIWENWPVKVGA